MSFIQPRLLIWALVATMISACGSPAEDRLADDSTTEAEATRTETSENPSALDLDEMVEPSFTASETNQILAKYGHLDPKRIVPQALLEKAVLYFEANKSRFANQNYISVIDFSKKSTNARFFIVDLKTGSVWAIRTAHGSGSDREHDGFAETFSNVSGSNASSLGHYRTAETYSGKWGLSLRLDGLSTTNSKARARAIVIHGASYVKEADVIQGRSWGCPAVAMANRDRVVNQLKGGSLIYAGLSGVR